MQRNKLIDRFKGYSNYREFPITDNLQNEEEKKQTKPTERLRQQYQKEQQIDSTPGKNIDKIKRLYLSSEKKPISK